MAEGDRDGSAFMQAEDNDDYGSAPQGRSSVEAALKTINELVPTRCPPGGGTQPTTAGSLRVTLPGRGTRVDWTIQ